MDHFLEQFNLDPIGQFDDVLLESGTDDIWDYINEAREGATKKNIIQKLWGLIKKAAAWIWKKLQQLWKFVKGLFSRKQTSINDVLEDATISANISVSNNTAKSNNTATGSKENDVIKSITHQSNGMDKIEVEIKTKDESGKIVSVPTAIMVAQGISVKLRGDEIVFNVDATLNGGYYNFRFRDNREDVGSDEFARKQGMPNSRGMLSGLYLLYKISSDDQYYLAMNDLATGLKTLSVYSEENDASRAIENLTKNAKLLRGVLDKNFSLNGDYALSEIEKCVGLMNNLAGACSTDTIISDPRLVDVLNDISYILLLLQFGINVLTGTIVHLYDPDPKYFGICKDTKSLDICVEEMLRRKIPSKFVARAAYLISDENLRAYSDINNPAFGQSRLALFPKDESQVIKVALNALGVHDNARDINTYNMVSKAGGADLLAKITGIEPQKCVETMERTLSSQESKANSNFRTDYNNLRRNLDALAPKGVIIKDAHENNVGYLNGKLVLFDYGQATSTTS